MEEMKVREWIRRFENGEFDKKDFDTQVRRFMVEDDRKK